MYIVLIHIVWWLTSYHGAAVCDTWLAGWPAVRNAGNLVPHAKLYDTETVSTEPAALELGCVVNGIKNVIVCGHSDCKVRESGMS